MQVCHQRLWQYVSKDKGLLPSWLPGCLILVWEENNSVVTKWQQAHTAGGCQLEAAWHILFSFFFFYMFSAHGRLSVVLCGSEEADSQQRPHFTKAVVVFLTWYECLFYFSMYLWVCGDWDSFRNWWLFLGCSRVSREKALIQLLLLLIP